MLVDVSSTQILQEAIHDDVHRQELSGKVQQWTYENICKAIELGALSQPLTEEFILLDMANQPIEREAFQNLYELQLMGYIPIIERIERNEFLKHHMHIVDQLIHKGVLIHVDAFSIIGKNGRSVRRYALKLCKKRVVHLITVPKEGEKQLVMNEVDEVIRKKISSKYAALLKENKQNVLLKKNFHVPNNQYHKTRIFKRLARLGERLRR